jgi:hypothetical protein
MENLGKQILRGAQDDKTKLHALLLPHNSSKGR